MVLVHILLIGSRAYRFERKTEPSCDKGNIFVMELPVEKLIGISEVAIGGQETDLGGWCAKQLCGL